MDCTSLHPGTSCFRITDIPERRSHHAIQCRQRKSLEEVCAGLERAVPAHKFGLIATHNLRETMAKKGVDFDRECRVFEVCNPHQAKKVLETSMEISTALPCRISVYEEDGKVVLPTMKPSIMLGMFEVPELEPVAAEVEDSIVAIMQDAAT